MTDKSRRSVDWSFDEDEPLPAKPASAPAPPASVPAPKATLPISQEETKEEDTQEEDTRAPWLRAALGLKPDDTPFAWQQKLFKRLRKGMLDRALDIPTGLGKTSVMALWLVARALGAKLPRRLVYVVDRRAVVDQATEVASQLRQCVEEDAELKRALRLNRPLPISTLRGQHVDNREWLEDPACPAIVVGTVDMVGSRLLFEGYGVSRKMRPYHAGLLGADALVVLDEAHLVPPFERLLETIATDVDRFGPVEEARRSVVPRFHLMSLSATGRTSHHQPFGLTEKDFLPGTETRKRLDAKKRLSIESLEKSAVLAEVLAEHAWKLTEQGTRPVRCLLFSNQRKTAEAVKGEIEKRARADKVDIEEVELFVGARRVFEREEARNRLKKLGFLASSDNPRTKPAFVVATSAGEVGVDLDADHMVCDLVEWERMVQRLGRVNRRGEGDAQVIVVFAPSDDEAANARLVATRELLEELPSSDDGLDASPGALMNLKKRAADDARLSDLIASGSTPEPLYPPLTRPVVEAWAMTSLEEHTGRPEVEPWLRGWIPREEPQTTIAWREVLPLTGGGQLLPDAAREVFLDAAAPHLAERLEAETSRTISWLKKRLDAVTRTSAESAEDAQEASTTTTTSESSAPEASTDRTSAEKKPRRDEVLAVAMRGAKREMRTISALDLSNKEKRKDIEEWLQGATVLIDVRVGGLSSGLLQDDSPHATDVTTQRTSDGQPALPFRVRREHNQEEPDSPEAETSSPEENPWRQEARIPIERAETGDETQWIVVESLAAKPAGSEEGRSVSPHAQKLDEHQAWAEEEARALATRLSLTDEDEEMLALAACLHDEGKRARRWQAAFRAPRDGAVYGKTKSRPNFQILAGYRHELGSLPYAEKHERVLALDEERRDLCLHLIAAHHGRARPYMPTEGAEEPPSKLERRAQEIALRFARLQKRWGPWGLVWWEALLRAADQQASRRIEAQPKPRPSSKRNHG